MSSRFVIELNTKFKPVLIRKRKDFVNLLLGLMNEHEDAEKELLRYGVTVASKTEDDSKVVVNVDGETVFRR